MFTVGLVYFLSFVISYENKREIGLVINSTNYLKYQMRDLPLFDVETRLDKYKRLIQKELRRKKIFIEFHLWVSDQWFCPDGVPGFALPYYLFNADLMKLHKQQLGYAEGTTETQILKLMRHELGHAIDNAFGLRRNKSRQHIFGSSKEEYPKSYTPNPSLNNYVHYLGDFYAQSHPDEDFAETFAYWLDPNKKWKEKVLSPKVKQKINWFEENVSGLRLQDRVLNNNFRIDPIEKNKMTLGDYYNQLHQEHGYNSYRRVDRSLKVFFPQIKTGYKLSSLIRKHRSHLEKELAFQLGVQRFEINLALKRLAFRGDRLGIQSTDSDFRLKSISMIHKNYRYLKESNQLKFYL